MSFSDHKITAFTHRIADLPDQPNLPADELKARFDACPEELRVAHNALCDDAAALETRVSGHDAQINQISMEKFPDDTITKANLHPDFVTELDAKATQDELSAAVDTLEATDAAEAAAREAGDADLQAQLDDHTDTLAQKVEIYLGTITGNWTAQTVELPFAPEALIFIPCGGGKPCLLGQGTVAESENHERIAQLHGKELNFPSWTAPEDYTHMYLAIKKG